MNDAFTLKNLADQAFSQDPSKAEDLYTRSLALRPQFTGAYFNRGNLNIGRSRFLEAGNDFSLAWVHSNFDQQAALSAGRAYAMADHSLQSCFFFSKVPLKIFSDNDKLLLVSQLLVEMRISDAQNIIEQVKQEDIIKDRLKANIYLEMGDSTKAVNFFKSLLQDDPNGYAKIGLIAVLISTEGFRSIRTVLIDQASYNGLNGPFISDIATVYQYVFNELLPIKKFDYCYPLTEAYEYFLTKLDNPSTLFKAGTTYDSFKYLREMVHESGDLFEFGVRHGHSINLLAGLFTDREIFGFDSFIGLPERWGEEPAGSYSTVGQLPKVASNVSLIVGWIEDTLPDFLKNRNQKIAFMNIDVDIYSATKTILRETRKYLDTGTIIVFDEYIGNATWKEDEFKAFQEFVAEYKIGYEYVLINLYTKQVAVRIKSLPTV